MTEAKGYGLLALALLACAGLAVWSAFPAAAAGAGPFLVISAPWNGGPSEIVRIAGGQVVGPQSAPLAVLATDTTADALRRAGAWFVTSASSLSFLCTIRTL